MNQIKLHARLENLNRFIEFVTGFAEKNGFSKAQSDKIHLCLEEAIVNICNYAYTDNPEGEIKIFLEMENKDTLKIRIIDRGIPFDVLSHEDPDITAQASERQIGGLGIFFIKKMMDEVKYSREDDQNILTMTLKRQA